MPPLIKIKHLNHYFGRNSLRKRVLHDINLTIDPGEVAIITGTPGAGKTTLLSLIGALRSVQEGNLSILGKEISKASNQTLAQMRQKIGYLFQGHNLLPFMTVHQNVRMSLTFDHYPDRRRALAKVDEVLQAVGLGNYFNHFPEQLLEGQKQRVAIARALVNEPNLILADEPTVGLDRQTGREVMELLCWLVKKRQCTLLLGTEDAYLFDLADRIIYLEGGELRKGSLQRLAILSSSYLDAEISTSVTTSSTRLDSSSSLLSPSPHPSQLQDEVQPSATQNASIQADTVREPSKLSSPPLYTPPSSDLETLHSDSQDPHSDSSTPGAQTFVFDIAESSVNHSQQTLDYEDEEPVIPVSVELPDNIVKTFTIACIDDSRAMLNSLKSFLADDLFSVILIDDPIRALTELIKVRPELILLDITMPKLNGLQMCKLIRSHHAFTETPIIFITGESKVLNPEIVQTAGANDYLHKPFEQSDLLIKLFPYLS